MPNYRQCPLKQANVVPQVAAKSPGKSAGLRQDPVNTISYKPVLCTLALLCFRRWPRLADLSRFSAPRLISGGRSIQHSRRRGENADPRPPASPPFGKMHMAQHNAARLALRSPPSPLPFLFGPRSRHKSRSRSCPPVWVASWQAENAKGTSPQAASSSPAGGWTGPLGERTGSAHKQRGRRVVVVVVVVVQTETPRTQETMYSILCLARFGRFGRRCERFESVYFLARAGWLVPKTNPVLSTTAPNRECGWLGRVGFSLSARSLGTKKKAKAKAWSTVYASWALAHARNQSSVSGLATLALVFTCWPERICLTATSILSGQPVSCVVISTYARWDKLTSCRCPSGGCRCTPPQCRARAGD